MQATHLYANFGIMDLDEERIVENTIHYSSFHLVRYSDNKLFDPSLAVPTQSISETGLPNGDRIYLLTSMGCAIVNCKQINVRKNELKRRFFILFFLN